MELLLKVRLYDLPMINHEVLLLDENGMIVMGSGSLYKLSHNGIATAHRSRDGLENYNHYVCNMGVWISSGEQIDDNKLDVRAILLDKVNLRPIGYSGYPLGSAICFSGAVSFVGSEYGTDEKSLFIGNTVDQSVEIEKKSPNIQFIRAVGSDVFIAEITDENGQEGVVAFDYELNELWRSVSPLKREFALPPCFCGEYVFWPVGEGRDDKDLRYFELALLNKMTGERLWTRRISPLPQEINVFGNIIYWVSGTWASDEFRSAINRIDLISGEDIEPISMLPYERNGSAIYQNPAVNDKYIVCCNAQGMRVVILDRKTLAHLQTIDLPEGSYNPNSGSFAVWHGDSLFFSAMPVKGDLWTACTAVAVLFPYDGGEVFNPCVRPEQTQECIKIPTDKKPLHEYAITLHEAMPTPELIRWSHIFVGELLATKCDAYTNQKTTMDKQFNGVVHLRIPLQGLDADADVELKKMAANIEAVFFHKPYRGGRNRVMIEYA